MRWLGLWLVALGASCSFASDGLDLQTASGAGTPTAPAGAAEPSGTAGQQVMRARDVHARQLTVGILFAHKVTAKEGKVAASGPALDAETLAAQLGSRDVDARQLVLDVLYAHDVDARELTVREIHAAEVKIGDGD